MFSLFSHPVMTLLAILFSLILFVIIAVVIGAIIYFLVGILRKPKATIAKLESIATEVNFTDGIDAQEWATIRKIVAEQKQQEIEAATKERMVKAAGYDATS